MSISEQLIGTDGITEASELVLVPERLVLRNRYESGIQIVRQQSKAYAIAQRAIDLVVSVILLVLTLPIVLFLTVLIRLDSRGPAVFRQRRLGRDGKLFVFYKFRTMYVDARERFPDLYSYEYTPDEIESMRFKLPYDPRNTRVGRWLRRTSLDELPNLLNVLKGDMSLVGPRPEIPEMLQYYRWDQLPKFEVRPGVTGLAQVSGRNILRFQETIDADLRYVATRSLGQDIRILFRTVWAVIMRVGAL